MTTREQKRRWRDLRRARGLTGRGRPWKVLPFDLAAEHAEQLELTASVMALEGNRVGAQVLLIIADDLRQHAGRTLPS